MPILWRYLTGLFIRIVAVCSLAFVTVLITLQLDDIAHFAALGAPLHYVLLFALHQIPYILPIALPLSCLIGSLLIVQRLSTTHELTSLRASGFALRDIFAPIWLSAAFLTVGNFWITSELATHSHMQCHLLKTELRSINPLLLLNNKHLMRLKGFYFEALGPSRVGESASDVILAIPNKRHERVHLMLAQHLKANSQDISGENVTLISAISGPEAEDFDQILIENMEGSITHVRDFSDMLQKKVSTINNDYLQMPLLLVRISEFEQQLGEAKLKNESPEQIKALTNHLNRSLIEIPKRFSIALAVFSFSLMGTAFGINISRRKSYHPLYFVIGLTTLYLIAFFTAKGLDHRLWLATALYMIPHLLLIGASLIALRRASKGIE